MFSWTLHQKGSPKEHGAAVAVRHELYYFGRRGEKEKRRMIDVQVFNTVTLRWKKLTKVRTGRGQPHRKVFRCYGFTAVLIEDTVYFWGGAENNTYSARHCNLLYAFDVAARTWFKPQVSGSVPEGRYYHSACVLGKVMFIHGGYTTKGTEYNDMYKLDTSTMVWSLINIRGPPPPDSWGHSATIIGTNMFVFGGRAHSYEYYYLNTIRVFDTATDHWLDTPSAQLLPRGRQKHSAFTYNGELYIFGGCNHNFYHYDNQDDYDNHNDHFNDLWKFSPETFSWKRVEPKGKGPSPTSGMCCCMLGDRIILVGGDKTPDDLYVLDLSPSLKTLCKLAVIQYGLEQSGLPHNIRWELAAMTSNSQLELAAMTSN